ncbi:MAG: hypothetical protein O7C59_03260, partial [Rickettsia endosymbiont of Ixodes persulcatus]|nr:hypothetical protein [Rickettsia endosymbiont of Ixodes persulcatus]
MEWEWNEPGSLCVFSGAGMIPDSFRIFATQEWNGNGLRCPLPGLEWEWNEPGSLCVFSGAGLIPDSFRLFATQDWTGNGMA